MTEREYDLIVIGAGPVGENIVDYAAREGLRCAIVESELVGGECSFWACIPSKAMLRPAAALDAARSVDGAGDAVTGSVDVEAVLKRRDSFVGDWDDSSGADWLSSVDVALFRGHGRLTGERRVEVDTTDGETVTLTAKHAVALSTGSDAAIPPVPGLAEADPWTSREATSVQDVPASLLIVGGGVVACEMATAYLGFGTEVTILARSGLLGGLEDIASAEVESGLLERGARILRTSPTSVERLADGSVSVATADGQTLQAAQILVAAGRTPRTEALGLETVGLAPGDWIAVDDTLAATGVDGGWLYAVGDVNHRALHTHQGKYQARAAGLVIAARAKGESDGIEPWSDFTASADVAAVPSVIFSEPEVASVGLTSTAAKKAGYRTRVIDYELGNVSGSGLHRDGYSGKARAVVDEDRRVLLGLTLVGPDVAELIHAATIAIVGEVPLERLWHAVPAFPTMNEIWLRLLESYRNDR